MNTRIRVTYATLSADNEDLHASYEEGVRVARSWLGSTVPAQVAGQARTGGTPFPVHSPSDTTLLLCTAHSATARDIDDAVRSATDAYPRWRRTPLADRVNLLRRAADLISDRSPELAALMSMEVGKNRLEALGDVEESADLIRYYCDQITAAGGFTAPMATLSAAETTSSVLRPYGPWGVISPFNFPMALAAGPAGAALVAGNPVLLKPSPQGTFTAAKFHECLMDAGIPADVVHLLPGGDEVGAALVAHEGVAGLTFTGSTATGAAVRSTFTTRHPKPVITETGGKNPTVITASADIATAVAGVTRSAFGLSGQKCSACSRVYVERPVYEEFVTKLAAAADALVVGDATERPVFVGPVVDAAAVDRFTEAVAHARANGQVVTGGGVLGGTEGRPDGHFVAPTVVTGLPVDDRLFRDELFVPLVVVAPVDSLDEAVALANDTEYGLTAGIFSGEQAEIDQFLDEIEAGVVYVNRAAGATTGAWPGVQPFGGWKGSGSSGKAGGGPHYVQLYLREQSRTVVSS